MEKSLSYSFVVITDDYIEYLRKEEPHVMSNKADERTYHRKYIGIIEELNGFKYFVPLSSPKAKDYMPNGTIKKDSLTSIYIKDGKNLFATLRFNNMIPVPDSEIISYDLNDEGDFIRQNGNKIEKTARNLYAAKKNQANEPDYKQAILNVTLDFSKLEVLCVTYK